jgi:hypothetical protein
LIEQEAGSRKRAVRDEGTAVDRLSFAHGFLLSPERVADYIAGLASKKSGFVVKAFLGDARAKMQIAAPPLKTRGGAPAKPKADPSSLRSS